MDHPLAPPKTEVGEIPSDDWILDRFLAWASERGLTLYPAQEEALLELGAGKNVVLATPTGSGKSLVAAFLHFQALCRGEISYYTSPIKALASEKFFDLCRLFGPDQVSLATGDASVNPEGRVVCCTAEVLANTALRRGARAAVDHAVLDEFHYYSDRSRGVAWQLPLLELSRTRFLLMSATLGDTTAFERALTALNGRETAVVRSKVRPVPLEPTWQEVPLGEALQGLVRAGRAPVYVVSFTQRGAAEEAQNLMSLDWLPKEKKREIAEELKGFRFDSPYGQTVSRFVRHGIGLHHAGLLPKYRLLVEKLAQKGLLQIISGTDTLGVGVNIPIRTVLLTKLAKFDGEKTALLTARDFHQITGRAGRKGFDEKGWVVALAPEHVVENLRLEAKAGGDPVKLKRIVRKRPPEHGYVHWDRATFERLLGAEPEPLVSRFAVSHGLVLQVLSRDDEDGCRALVRLVRRSHEPPRSKRLVARQTRSLVRSLLQAGLLERARAEDGGRRVRVHADLQQNFSLHQALSLFLLHAIREIPDEHEQYSLAVLTLVESILEDPEIVLQKQLDKLKTEKVAELKAAGVEYEDRMKELEKLEHPKPEREFVYETFNAYARVHPWVGENIRPKSIAREIVERMMTFDEYVREYGLERAEGTLLRYLSDVVKVLAQTVPEPDKTNAIRDLEAYLRAVVTETDASLLEEWERLRDPRYFARLVERVEKGEAPEERRLDVTRDVRAFTVMVRNRVFSLVRALAAGRFDEGLALLDAAAGEDARGEAIVWTAPLLERRTKEYLAEHGELRTDVEARAPRNTIVWRDEKARSGTWRVEQVLTDAEGATPWVLVIEVDLARSREVEGAALRLVTMGPP